MKKSSKREQSPNSLYRLGGMEILSIEQDEISKLWKIYLSTPEHYLVSREFDRSVGMYANAPDDIVRKGLMDFSESILGKELSLWKIIDMFIDRCFDERVFVNDTENAVWMSIDYPSYEEVEDILMTYNSRIRWFDQTSDIGELMNIAMFKTLAGDGKRKLAEGLSKSFSENNISLVFMNPDDISSKIMTEGEFSEIPLFVGEFSEDGDFVRFKYVKR